MNPKAHLLSLAKIIQELNHANGRSVDALRAPGRATVQSENQHHEQEILQQRLQLIDILLRHQQELLHDSQSSGAETTPAHPDQTRENKVSPSQDWGQMWLQIIRHNAPPRTYDREMEQELQQLILLSLRLFHRMGLDPAQALNDLSLKLAQQDTTIEHQAISPDRYCKP